MVKAGGLGRGLASLIPQTPTTKKTKTKQQTTQTKEKANKKGEEVLLEKKVTEQKRREVVLSSDKTKTQGKIRKSQNRQRQISFVAIEKIKSNPWQPRRNFSEDKLAELAASIKEHGIIQPLIVTKQGGIYELIAGERRLEAGKLAGLKEAPVIVQDSDEREKAVLALVENIQRHDLNPMEEARAFQRLIAEFGFKQEEVARYVGKSRSAVANTLRLLKLPQRIQNALLDNKITEGHARALLSLEDKNSQLALLETILRDNWSVRKTETAIAQLTKKKRRNRSRDADLLDWQNKLVDRLQTRVRIVGNKNKGQIKIDYYSPEELQSIIDRIS